MDKTLNINIAGSVFSIEEEAYKILRDYLQSLDMRFRNVKGGTETIEDIELRIAEIFHSQKGNAGVINKENVEAMISVIGKPEDFDISDTQKEYEEQPSAEVRKRLYRNPDDTIIAGVCGGIGAYLNTDPVLIRILFVLFTAFFAAGFFMYVVLWIALPPANNDSRKKEMYGSAYARVMAMQREAYGTGSYNSGTYNKGYYQTSRVGSAINEVFRALGRIMYIIMRIFLIIVGISLLLAGFLFLLTLVLIFILKIPGAVSAGPVDFNIMYLPDFITYIVSPSVYPWILILSAIVVILPLAALIYWGVKMIFWFRANDGILSLSLLVIWVLSVTTLTIMLFSEGISFAEDSKVSSVIPIDLSADTLYIKTGNSVASLMDEKSLPLITQEYSLIMNKDRKELYISPWLEIEYSGNEHSGITVTKKSSGNNEIAALNIAKEIPYNYSISEDSIILDDYFLISSSRKWSADQIEIKIGLPAGTVVKTDSGIEKLLNIRACRKGHDSYFPLEKKDGFSLWKVTEENLVPLPAR